MGNADFSELRKIMVREQIQARGITSPDMLKAFNEVPRHIFVPEEKRNLAYEDCPLSIGSDQTISQPYIVALMTDSLAIRRGDKVLEIGTGSGYQTAILSFLGARVYSIERLSTLAKEAQKNLASLGYNVTVAVGDGTEGWRENAPYDKIIVTAATPQFAHSWQEQLTVGGKIVAPIGGKLAQDLIVADKISTKHLSTRLICSCRFVPLIGKYGFKE
ncbi:MAG: protein-L-isoaspartate(D-aspartate) O-methyltransferase [Candidatus Omnitrophica bacterium]|nr:protein-L-isoaspartate(D-aspartate) O-methyltransferase [Candidatus Omnitrophota bacterium]